MSKELEDTVMKILKDQGLLAQLEEKFGEKKEVDPDEERELKRQKVIQEREELVDNSDRAVNAVDAVNIHLLSNFTNYKFSPTFAHQMFEGEVIVGYTDLQIDLYYHATTLETCFTWKYSSFQPSFTHKTMNEEEKVVVSSFKGDDIEASLKICTPSNTFARTEFALFDTKVINADLSKWTPPGTLYHKYNNKNKEGEVKKAETKEEEEKNKEKINEEEKIEDEECFEVYLSNPSEDERARAFQTRAESLPFWFIDAASTADFSDSRWRLLHLFKKTKDGRVFCGFVSVFLFVNPLRAERETALRICQMLILPPFQRQGHGYNLIFLCYRLAEEVNAFEITVEDPAEGFSLLRDRIDMKLVLEKGIFVDNLMQDRTYFPSPSDWKEAQYSSRLNESQLNRCYEALRMQYYKEENEEDYKTWRLCVKKRLNRVHSEMLLAIENKEEKKKELNTLFEAEKQKYLLMLKKVKHSKVMTKEGEEESLSTRNTPSNLVITTHLGNKADS